ncbi:predicted protein [Botrytis cinerea T4]|uniref:Uncharacterized protein n=1 Tax=Botryotinia fuckeliana (strain T4) TaxID=999810 RepID=G2YU15_BOTF4|nr:predicted protein [Botrytis cinerea T4]
MCSLSSISYNSTQHGAAESLAHEIELFVAAPIAGKLELPCKQEQKISIIVLTITNNHFPTNNTPTTIPYLPRLRG